MILILGFQLSRYYRRQKQKSWALFMLLRICLVAHCLSYIYAFAAYILYAITFSRGGFQTEIGNAAFIMKMLSGGLLFLYFGGELFVHIWIHYPVGIM